MAGEGKAVMHRELDREPRLRPQLQLPWWRHVASRPRLQARPENRRPGERERRNEGVMDDWIEREREAPGAVASPLAASGPFARSASPTSMMSPGTQNQHTSSYKTTRLVS